MPSSHLGEIAALCTAVFWTITALCFEQAARRVGSLALNWIRLVMGMTFLSLFTWLYRGSAFPADATGHMWLWLSLSGLIGFTFGDLCLFQAFVLIGSRISMLMMALVPPFTAIMSWAVMGEVMTPTDLTGMFLVTGGIALVVLERPAGGKRIQLSHPVLGLVLALGGAMGQATGLVLSKYGMGVYNAFSSTQIRGFAGILGFSVLFFPLKRWGRIRDALCHKSGLGFTTAGAFFGPFLGVSFSLLAVQNTATGVASTIMAIVPVLIIPPAVLIFRERVTIKEVLGAFIAVGGVALLFIH